MSLIILYFAPYPSFASNKVKRFLSVLLKRERKSEIDFRFLPVRYIYQNLKRRNRGSEGVYLTIMEIAL